MRRSRKIMAATGIVLLAAIEIINSARLATPSGARVAWPETGSSQALSITASGDAWMSPGPGSVASIEVVAKPEGGQAVAPLAAPAAFAKVKGGKGAASYALPSWTARVELPAPGAWSLRAVARSSDGRRVESEPRRFTASAAVSGGVASGFSAFSAQHLAALAAVAVLVAAIALLARRGGPGWPAKAGPFLALAIWGNELAYQAYWMAVGGWTTPDSLMLQMCGLSIIFLPLCLMMDEGRGRRALADVFYFWGLGGAIQALLTPDIGASGFPSYRYFSFFISHGLIVACVAALVASRAIRIDARSLLRCVVVSNIVIVPIYLIDRLFVLVPPYAPGNYFAIGYPPPTGSPIDLLVDIFGPSPRYVVGLEIMAIVAFTLLWLPWGLTAFRRASIGRRAVAEGRSGSAP